jgi:phage terminase small subunit
MALLADPNRNATAAFKAAGFKGTEGAARVGAYELMRDPRVQTLIAQHESNVLANARANAGVSLERTLKAIAQTAFYDARKLYDANGAPIPIHELPDDVAMAIEGIEVVETWAGTGEDRVFTGYIKKYKLARRTPAHDMLMKHLNGYKAHEEGKAVAQADALANLLGSMRRSALPVVERVPDDELV